MDPTFGRALEQLSAVPHFNSPEGTAMNAVTTSCAGYVESSAKQRQQMFEFSRSEAVPAPTASFELKPDIDPDVQHEHIILHSDLRCCHHCHVIKEKLSCCAKCLHAWCAARI